MSDENNPCRTCEADQQCCKVLGLKLSKHEFETFFRKHSERLSVIKYNEMYIVYPRNNLPCPYWDEKKGCGIYEDRPIDCMLYPYDLHQIMEKNGTVEIELYDQTDCPHKETLYIPVEDAENLIKTLAREVFGVDKPINIKFIPGKKPPRQFGFLNPVIARLSKIIRAHKEKT